MAEAYTMMTTEPAAAQGFEYTRMPIIGVLCIDIAAKLSELYGFQNKSYIAASYVKYLEGAGARVVPVWIGKEKNYYEDIMNKLNGILIPGGAVYFDSEMSKRTQLSNACVRSSRYIYEIALNKNQSGEYFPLWGTCLGMQLLLLHSAKGVDARESCERMDCSMPLVFEPDFRRSKLFDKLTLQQENIMKKEPVAFHYHRYCLTKQALIKTSINEQWQVLASNKDPNGFEFITLIEHRSFPFYGCQFHPERNCYEQLGYSGDLCNHTIPTIDAAQYFATFFVGECLKSKNQFFDLATELSHLIYNYELVFTGSHTGVHWAQCYLFDEFSDYLSNC